MELPSTSAFTKPKTNDVDATLYALLAEWHPPCVHHDTSSNGNDRWQWPNADVAHSPYFDHHK